MASLDPASKTTPATFGGRARRSSGGRRVMTSRNHSPSRPLRTTALMPRERACAADDATQSAPSTPLVWLSPRKISVGAAILWVESKLRSFRLFDKKTTN
jgi:hypothetical protein